MTRIPNKKLNLLRRFSTNSELNNSNNSLGVSSTISTPSSSSFTTSTSNRRSFLVNPFSQPSLFHSENDLIEIKEEFQEVTINTDTNRTTSSTSSSTTTEENTNYFNLKLFNNSSLLKKNNNNILLNLPSHYFLPNIGEDMNIKKLSIYDQNTSSKIVMTKQLIKEVNKIGYNIPEKVLTKSLSKDLNNNKDNINNDKDINKQQSLREKILKIQLSRFNYINPAISTKVYNNYSTNNNVKKLKLPDDLYKLDPIDANNFLSDMSQTYLKDKFLNYEKNKLEDDDDHDIQNNKKLLNTNNKENNNNDNNKNYDNFNNFINPSMLFYQNFHDKNKNLNNNNHINNHNNNLDYNQLNHLGNKIEEKNTKKKNSVVINQLELINKFIFNDNFISKLYNENFIEDYKNSFLTNQDEDEDDTTTNNDNDDEYISKNFSLSLYDINERVRVERNFQKKKQIVENLVNKNIKLENNLSYDQLNKEITQLNSINFYTLDNFYRLLDYRLVNGTTPLSIMKKILMDYSKDIEVNDDDISMIGEESIKKKEKKGKNEKSSDSNIPKSKTFKHKLLNPNGEVVLAHSFPSILLSQLDLFKYPSNNENLNIISDINGDFNVLKEIFNEKVLNTSTNNNTWIFMGNFLNLESLNNEKILANLLKHYYGEDKDEEIQSVILKNRILEGVECLCYILLLKKIFPDRIFLLLGPTELSLISPLYNDYNYETIDPLIKKRGRKSKQEDTKSNSLSLIMKEFISSYFYNDVIKILSCLPASLYGVSNIIDIKKSYIEYCLKNIKNTPKQNLKNFMSYNYNVNGLTFDKNNSILLNKLEKINDTNDEDNIEQVIDYFDEFAAYYSSQLPSTTAVSNAGIYIGYSLPTPQFYNKKLFEINNSDLHFLLKNEIVYGKYNKGYKYLYRYYNNESELLHILKQNYNKYFNKENKERISNFFTSFDEIDDKNEDGKEDNEENHLDYDDNSFKIDNISEINDFDDDNLDANEDNITFKSIPFNSLSLKNISVNNKINYIIHAGMIDNNKTKELKNKPITVLNLSPKKYNSISLDLNNENLIINKDKVYEEYPGKNSTVTSKYYNNNYFFKPFFYTSSNLNYNRKLLNFSSEGINRYTFSNDPDHVKSNKFYFNLPLFNINSISNYYSYQMLGPTSRKLKLEEIDQLKDN